MFSGNPWPPVNPHPRDNRNSLLNVLVESAKRDYRKKKYDEIASEINKQTIPSATTDS